MVTYLTCDISIYSLLKLTFIPVFQDWGAIALFWTRVNGGLDGDPPPWIDKGLQATEV